MVDDGLSHLGRQAASPSAKHHDQSQQSADSKDGSTLLLLPPHIGLVRFAGARACERGARGTRNPRVLTQE
jgi:hypothetical protein